MNNPSPAAQVAAILAAQMRPITVAQNQARKRGQADLKSANATRLSVIQALQAGIPVAKGTYDEALGQTEHLAENAAQMLSAANPNAQNQEDLRSIGAPPEQQALLAGQAQAQFPGQGAVLYTQQGAIPGADLLAQREAHLGLLAGLPTVAALQGEETARGIRRQQGELQDKYLVDLLGVTGQAPQLLSQLTQQNVENQRANRDERFRQVQFNAQQAAAKAAATGDARDRADANYWKRIEARQNQQRINAETQVSPLDVYKAQTDRINAKRERQAALSGGAGASLQYKSNSDGSVDIFNPTTGEITRVQGGTGKKGTAGLTSYQRRELQKQAGATVQERVVDGYKNADGTVVHDSYQETMRQMLTAGIPLVYAQKALNAVYKTPGFHFEGEPQGEGRPKYSYQQRKSGRRKKPKAKRTSGLQGPVG